MVERGKRYWSQCYAIATLLSSGSGMARPGEGCRRTRPQAGEKGRMDVRNRARTERRCSRSAGNGRGRRAPDGPGPAPAGPAKARCPGTPCR